MSRRYKKRRDPVYVCRTCYRESGSITEHLFHVDGTRKDDEENAHREAAHVVYPPRRGLDARETRRLRQQHKRVMSSEPGELMSFRAWIRYISRGQWVWSQAAQRLMIRKGMKARAAA
jgi:hypothetical protein